MITAKKKEPVVIQTQKVHFPNLDGLRFVAFFCVFMAHSFYSENPHILSLPLHQNIREVAHHGIYGVNFFFVLSGFLITYLLLQEEQKFGRVHIRAFYMRRILRIWPLYYLVVFIGFVLFPLGKSLLGESGVETANIWYYLLFISNYDGSPVSAVLGVLWSIAVEEQFYLFWPLLLGPLFRSHKIYVFYSIILCSFLWRLSGNGGYSDTLSCISDMAVGGLGAYYAFNNPKVIHLLQAIPKGVIVSIYGLGFTMILTHEVWIMQSPLLPPLERLLFSLFFLFIILEQNYASQSWFKMSRWPLISRRGTYTYGLYMLHFPVIYVTGKIIRTMVGDHSLFHVLVTETVAAFMVSLITAYCLFHFYEKRFLKMKDKFSFIKR